MPDESTTCPVCGGEQRLRTHCPTNKACTWRECSNPVCRTTIDVRNGQHTHPQMPTSCRICGPLNPT